MTIGMVNFVRKLTKKKIKTLLIKKKPQEMPYN